MQKIKFIGIIVILIIQITSLLSQDVKWKRSEESDKEEQEGLMLFQSLYSLNLPTAETLQQGDWHISIAHRFYTPISDGVGELWGIDGRVSNRFEIGYAPIDELLLIIARSNYEGNIDLQGRYKALEFENETAPTLVTANIGIAYNGKSNPEPEKVLDRFQWFAQGIVNIMFLDKTLGIGFVPSYLYNAHIYCDCAQYSFTMGGYAQYYVGEMWSFLTEFNSTVTGWRGNGHNSFAIGAELQTAGHFFKVLVGTNIYMNMSGYLAGSNDSFSSGKWHLGFNITRTL